MEAINSLAGKWFNFMVNSSFQLTVLFIILFLFSYFFRKRSALFLYSLWIIFLVKAVLPPSIPIPLLKNPEILPQISIRSYTTAVTHPIDGIIAATPGFRLNSLLLIIWIGVIIFLLGFILLKNFFFRKKLQQARPIDGCVFLDKSFETEDQDLSRIKFYIQERIASPFTLNLRHPRIYLPPDWFGWEPKQKQAVVLHEFAHIKRKDQWVILLQSIIQIFYFFHPAVWMANRYISAYREQACDDYVISRLKNKALEYCKMIISSLDRSRGSKRYSSFVSCFVQDKRALIKRFEYLINRKEEIMQKFKVTEKIVLGVLCLFTLVLSLKSVERSPDLQEKMITREYPSDEAGEIYVRYDTPPIPLKGFAGLAESIAVPEKTMSNQVEGSVYVTVHIDKSGETKTSSDIRTSGDCGYAETLAVIDALKKSQWNPALKKGNAIESQINLIFVFKLDEDTKRIYVEVIPPPPPPPLPPRAFDAAPPKASPVPPPPRTPPAISPKDRLVSPQPPLKADSPLPPKTAAVPAPPSKPDQAAPPMVPAVPSPPPLAPSSEIPIESSTPLSPTKPLSPDIAVPAPPPPPQTPWENPEFLRDRDLDINPEPVIGMDKLAENIHASQRYKKNSKFAQGILIIGVLVDETGNLNAVLVLKPSGHKELDQTIIDFLSETKWKPGEKDGSPVKSKRVLTFSFKD